MEDGNIAKVIAQEQVNGEMIGTLVSADHPTTVASAHTSSTKGS